MGKLTKLQHHTLKDLRTPATEIQVKTGADLSARWMAWPVTGQGGGGAALASALNLDLDLDSYFKGSIDEEGYGRVRLQPLIYMDDTLIQLGYLGRDYRRGHEHEHELFQRSRHYEKKSSCVLAEGGPCEDCSATS